MRARLLSAFVMAFGGALLCRALPALAEVAGGDHGGGSTGGGMPQMDVSTYASQLFWLGATFLVLFVIFSKKTLPDISDVLEKRKSHIRSDVETAETLRQEAEAAKQAYEKLMSDSRAQSTRLLSEAAADIKKKTAQELESFRARAAQEVAGLESALTRAKADAMEDMHNIVAEVASEAASRIVGIKPDLKQAQTVVQSLKNREAA